MTDTSTNDHASLQHELDSLRDRFATQTTAAELAVMAGARAGLLESGRLARCLHQGDRAPAFTLPDPIGRPVNLSHILAMGPAVITFYRGAWCPYCNLTLRAYQKVLPDIRRLGATLLAISPERPDREQAVLLKNFLQYTVLSDLGNGVARQFGLVYQLTGPVRELFLGHGIDLAAINGDDSWELPLPGTFVVDRNGIVRLASVDVDPARRMEPAAIIAVLTELASG